MKNPKPDLDIREIKLTLRRWLGGTTQEGRNDAIIGSDPITLVERLYGDRAQAGNVDRYNHKHARSTFRSTLPVPYQLAFLPSRQAWQF